MVQGFLVKPIEEWMGLDLVGIIGEDEVAHVVRVAISCWVERKPHIPDEGAWLVLHGFLHIDAVVSLCCQTLPGFCQEVVD